jgi:hypothetical protein
LSPHPHFIPPPPRVDPHEKEQKEGTKKKGILKKKE